MAERMANERVLRRRRIRNVLLAAAAILAALIVFGNRFYHTVQAPHWDVIAKGAAKARERCGLKVVEEVERFVGDRPYVIAYGNDAEGVPVMVWIWEENGEDVCHAERLEDGVAREDIRKAALRRRPEARILRITAGRLHGEFVWEVFSEAREPGGVRKYYDYYRFRDGTLMETYRLALER